MRKCQPLCIAAAAVVTVISLHFDAPASAEDWDAAKAKFALVHGPKAL